MRVVYIPCQYLVQYAAIVKNIDAEVTLLEQVTGALKQQIDLAEEFGGINEMALKAVWFQKVVEFPKRSISWQDVEKN